MDVGIKDIGITFLVGAYTILAIEWVLFRLTGKSATGFFYGTLGLATHADKAKNASSESMQSDRDPTMTAAVFAGIAFGVGILAEDLSYKYMDSVPIPSLRSILNQAPSISPDEKKFQSDSRFRVLVRFNGQEVVPQWLGIDLGKSKAFSLARIDGAARVEAWMTGGVKLCGSATGEPKSACPNVVEGEPCLEQKMLGDSIIQLYYFAKNKVYSDKNYYDEMRKIQARMEFSRSIALISFGYAGVAVTAILACILLARNGWKDAVINGSGCVLAFALIFAASAWAYESEADEFNKRAFGYFSTMLISASRDTSLEP